MSKFLSLARELRDLIYIAVLQQRLLRLHALLELGLDFQRTA